MKKDICKEEAGILSPVIDFNKCEAKGPCIEVCPYDVFEMQKIADEDFSKLTFIGKLKTKAHGNKKAYAIKPMDCHACGLCVTACPESAIKLIKNSNQ
ncbi:MAG TPA: ferredoxin family protein [Rhodothermales bacterium]|nr:ferredoxin family protein [Rhodothermales bacterium]